MGIRTNRRATITVKIKRAVCSTHRTHAHALPKKRKPSHNKVLEEKDHVESGCKEYMKRQTHAWSTNRASSWKLRVVVVQRFSIRACYAKTEIASRRLLHPLNFSRLLVFKSNVEHRLFLHAVEHILYCTYTYAYKWGSEWRATYVFVRFIRVQLRYQSARKVQAT